jgi:diguanylate cyclase (GGDEF)-like protein
VNQDEILQDGTLPGGTEAQANPADAQRHTQGLISQLRGIIRTLLSAVGSMRSSSDGPDLTEIEDRIMEVQTLEGLSVAREDLELAVGQLTKSERTRKQEATALLTRLQERLLILEEYANKKNATFAPPAQEHADSRPSESNSESIVPSRHTPASNDISNSAGALIDRLTGLPNREAAEAAILALETNSRNKHLAAFYIQNMRQLNVRFGDRICDELLFLITQRIATTLLRPADRIFRWRGPAFVAILEREESFSYVNHDLKRFVEHPFQFEFRSGSLLVFISIAAELIGPECCSAAERVQELEKFFSSF